MGIGYVQHTYLGLQPMGIPQIMENKKTNDMKNLKYILLAILLGINLVACEAPPINEEIGVEEVNLSNDNLRPEDDEGGTDPV